ncbi:MAG: hypothetical protein Q8P12_06220 [bacterium]|nr:hypothetical protein [bacterium]
MGGTKEETMGKHEFDKPRTEVTVEELAKKYGVNRALVENAIPECVNDRGHARVQVGPGRYRITHEDAIRLRNYLQR